MLLSRIAFLALRPEQKVKSIAKVIKKNASDAAGLTPTINQEIMNVIVFSDEDTSVKMNISEMVPARTSIFIMPASRSLPTAKVSS